jgi:hypothetical protein
MNAASSPRMTSMLTNCRLGYLKTFRQYDRGLNTHSGPTNIIKYANANCVKDTTDIT